MHFAVLCRLGSRGFGRPAARASTQKSIALRIPLPS